MMLVSLKQASEHIRRDTDADDDDLILKIKAASQAVINYLKDGADAFLDSHGNVILDSSDNPEVPFEVQAAVLMLIDNLYNNRSGNETYAMGYLPEPVMALLYPLRTPALA